MSTAYEPNIQGAIAVLRDLMIANSFTMTREPYEPNYRGLVDAVIDLKEGFPTFAPLQVGFDATAFENVTEGDALYMRTSDGQVGKASASNGLQENAQVVGFANADASANATVKVIVIGIKSMTGLDAGFIFSFSFYCRSYNFNTTFFCWTSCSKSRRGIYCNTVCNSN